MLRDALVRAKLHVCAASQRLQREFRSKREDKMEYRVHVREEEAVSEGKRIMPVLTHGGLVLDSGPDQKWCNVIRQATAS